MQCDPSVSRGKSDGQLPCLLLHVRSEFFEQIRSGVKAEEYRLDNAYWRKRLMHGSEGACLLFRSVVICNAYKTGPENRLEFPWRGWRTMRLTHPHFGAEAVDVFAIRLAGAR
jgi:hypothetical protein